LKETRVSGIWLGVALVAAVMLSGMASPAGCGQHDGSIEGYWKGVQDGGWAFVYQFIEISPARYKGLIHVYKDDMKMEEVPIENVDFAAGKVKMRVKLNNIRIEGDLDPDGQAIQATYFYQDGTSLDMPLVRVEPGSLTGLTARPVAPGEKYVYKYAKPGDVGDGWKTASLESQDVDRKPIEALVTAVAAGDFGYIHSLVIARNGKLVLDEYFYGYDSEAMHRLASVTKSVTSLLVGIAIDRQEIGGVDEKVAAFFPNYAAGMAAGWENVTLGDILSMSAGAAWDQDDLAGFYESGDRFGVVFRQPVTAMPGEKFEYVSPNVDLFAGVIKHATGMHADAYADRYLFGPLEFGAYDWEAGKWEGYPLMDGSLRLRPRDMAKLGQVVLDGGEWDGERIVSAGWIDVSTAAHMDADGPDDYGYLWWLTSAPFEGRTVRGIFANGWGSQFVFILPDYNLVVVTTGGNDDNGKHLAPLKMFPEYILPALK
jgi:CubicO group peptidase (beta-lactamase class C family)